MPTIAANMEPRAGAADGAAPAAHAQRTRRRVLMITQRTPFPPDKGDRIRSYHLLKFLSQYAQVDLATLADEAVSRETEVALRELTRNLEVVPVDGRRRWLRGAASALRGRSATEGLFASPELARRLARLTAANAYDLVVVVCSGMAQFLEGLPLGNAKILIDFVDVDSEKWLDYSEQSSGWRRALYGLEGRRVRQLEIELAGKCDQLAVTTHAEVACMRAFHPDANVAAIPNGVDFDFFRPNEAQTPDPQSCAFVGALDYKPNVDGVQWFCDAIWPDVRKSCPAARFAIVGRRPVEAVRRLGDVPGVEVIADVPDVRPYLWQAGLVLAPLRIARGVQNKVLEALAVGKPVIATPNAIAGLDVTVGEHLYQAETPGEWCAALRRLMESDGERRRLAAAGRAFVCERHNWASCLAPVLDLLEPARRSA